MTMPPPLKADTADTAFKVDTVDTPDMIGLTPPTRHCDTARLVQHGFQDFTWSTWNAQHAEIFDATGSMRTRGIPAPREEGGPSN